MKKRPPFNENAAIRGAIRRTFSRSPVVREVLLAGRREVPKFNKDGTRAKKNAVQYQCEVCNEWVSSTKVAVDHIDPVISTEAGFVDWNQFVDRLFCDKGNLQRICEDCHQKKTNAERASRALKKDYQILSQLEAAEHLLTGPAIKDSLKKFTKKKLSQYPQDFKERVENLRARLKAHL